MGFDLTVKFADPACYERKRPKFMALARELPSFLAASPSEEEIWLKGAESQNTWTYDARLFFRPESLSVEVTWFTSSFHRDIRGLIVAISGECEAVLLDDDSEPF